MNIAMVGTGYVGLVSGVCFSDFGHNVVCVDKDGAKIDQLNAGNVPIYEPGLKRLMEKNTDAGRLGFSTDLEATVKGADAVFIAVGTPERRGDGYADLSYLFEAVEEIADALNAYKLIVTKSTVPVGTNKKIKEIITARAGGVSFDIASNPEFLCEGNAIDDFMHPDRIIVGVETQQAERIMAEIYRPIATRDIPVVTMDIESAELTKYAANAFLATKITFVNEIATLCEKVGANIANVTHGMGFDMRIGARFLNAGPGYGGSCFPKDTKALTQTGKDNACPLRIVETVIDVNERIKSRMVDKIIDACGGDVRAKRLAILGCSFKPETDDMREAPALKIIPALQAQGAEISLTDPQAEKAGRALLENVVWARDAYACVKGADCVVLMTEWNQFRALELKRLSALMRDGVMVDLRNIYTEEMIKEAGFRLYRSVGRREKL